MEKCVLVADNIQSDCCLTPTQQFSAISWWEQDKFQWDDDDEVCFVLDQHAQSDFYIASSLKQQSKNRHVAPLGVGHIILIPSQHIQNKTVHTNYNKRVKRERDVFYFYDIIQICI